MSKLLVILGSTSTGKTDLALQLAHKFQGELVSADSRQVYKSLDVGTGKLPGKEVKVIKGEGFWIMDGMSEAPASAVKIWMYDAAGPKKQYTVYDYVKDANKVIDDILKRGKLPIVVGGTGLYLKALLEGLPNLDIPIDLKLRKELDKLSKEELQNKLKQIPLDRWDKLNESDKQNPRRLIRAIEIALTSSPPRCNSVTPRRWGNILKIGLNAPREILYQRIDERVLSRINQGMVEEAEKLHREGLTFQRMRQLGLEYGVLADYLDGKITSRQELVKIMQGKIHGFARKQITWFKKEKGVYWFDITQSRWVCQVESKVNSWYYSLDDKKN